MTEPQEIAADLEVVRDGIWHWRIHNAAIGGGISSSHAFRVVLDDGEVGCVLVDPVRLHVHAMQRLPQPIVAIVLTSHGHQRAAWRIRRDHRAPVWAPTDSPGLEEAPDHTYDAGDQLPGGMVAVHTPGPEDAHFSLYLPDRSALLVSDLVRRAQDGRLEYVPAEYHEDPDATRSSARQLADLDFDLLLLDHGPPVVDDGDGALRELVAR